VKGREKSQVARVLLVTVVMVLASRRTLSFKPTLFATLVMGWVRLFKWHVVSARDREF
jgi:hypothetical protein